nr:unnamed protein product [Callosobruchus chinensis]
MITNSFVLMLEGMEKTVTVVCWNNLL